MRVWVALLIIVAWNATVTGTALPSGEPAWEDPLPQDDHHSGRDADDVCVPEEPPSITARRGEVVSGELRPFVDRADHYGFGTEPGRLSLRLHAHPMAPEEVSRILGEVDPLLLQVLTDRCETVHEAVIHGEGTLLVDLEGGHYALALSRDSLRPPGPHEAMKTGPIRFCHPPCASFGYELTIE